MISSELTLNHTAIIKNINSIYLIRGKKVFRAIKLNKIKIMLKTLFIVAVAHPFKSYMSAL